MINKAAQPDPDRSRFYMRKSIFALCLLAISSLACVVSAASTTPAQITPPQPDAAPTPAMRQAVVTAAEAVNVRERATEHSKDIGDLYRGKIVFVVECSGGWARLADGRGWVKARYIGIFCR